MLLKLHFVNAIYNICILVHYLLLLSRKVEGLDPMKP